MVELRIIQICKEHFRSILIMRLVFKTTATNARLNYTNNVYLETQEVQRVGDKFGRIFCTFAIATVRKVSENMIYLKIIS